MSSDERHAIMAGLQKEYIEWYGPRETWKDKTLGAYYRELGIMTNCVHILRAAGLLPPIAARDGKEAAK